MFCLTAPEFFFFFFLLLKKYIPAALYCDSSVTKKTFELGSQDTLNYVTLVCQHPRKPRAYAESWTQFSILLAGQGDCAVKCSVPSEAWRLHRDHLEGGPVPTGPDAGGLLVSAVDHVVNTVFLSFWSQNQGFISLY